MSVDSDHDKADGRTLEPDVTLTDFALAAESMMFRIFLIRRRVGTPEYHRIFRALLAALCAFSLFRGLWHRVLSDAETVVGR